jgi:hypothetical protein
VISLRVVVIYSITQSTPRPWSQPIRVDRLGSLLQANLPTDQAVEFLYDHLLHCASGTLLRCTVQPLSCRLLCWTSYRMTMITLTMTGVFWWTHPRVSFYNPLTGQASQRFGNQSLSTLTCCSMHRFLSFVIPANTH